MAMPTPLLIDRMKAAILTYAAEGTMYQTRRSASDAFIPVRINSELRRKSRKIQRET